MLIILGILVVLVVLVIVLYNSLVRAKHIVDEAWADIEVQLKRRYDLIPNLVETVKGYASHESGTLEKITQLRGAAMHAGSLAEQAAEENALSSTLKSLFAVSESYPDLKASGNFQQLQRDLTDTEDKIQAARRFYNGTVKNFNIKIETFPSNLLAGTLGFTKREYFDIPDNGVESQAVQVKF